MSATTEFTKSVLDKMMIGFKDSVFLFIQNDKVFMKQYLRLVETNGLDSVNTTIGKQIKDIMNLGNLDECKEPKSTLITTYTEHKLK